MTFELRAIGQVESALFRGLHPVPKYRFTVET